MNCYRTFENVPKGANLTIYCFLVELALWRLEHNGNFPVEIFAQFDSGSENANQYVLAILELIVARHMVKKIDYARLVKGHTHTDVDGGFGSIWNCCKTVPMLTVDSFKKLVENHFKDTKLAVKVFDVLVIPDYCKWLGPCIDPHLANYARLEQTQHCWRFESRIPSTSYPLGVKTCYRAYCSDKVRNVG
jgi:hypothetical protein